MIGDASLAGSLSEIARELEQAAPEEILSWAVESFGHDMALACSFGGPSGMVLLDMLVKMDARIPVYYLDTGLLFPETYALIERASQRYAVTPVAVTGAPLESQAEDYGEALWERNPDLCCNVRKVLPQREFMKQFSGWVSGIRRDQSTSRVDVPIVSADMKFGLIKVIPLANWTESMVWTYIHAHDVPYNPLHEQGYPSIGCAPCTARVSDGEDPRAGRWKGFTKTECGLHT